MLVDMGSRAITIRAWRTSQDRQFGNVTSEQAIEIIKEWKRHYGAPKQVMSEHDGCFMSDNFSTALSELSIAVCLFLEKHRG